MFIFGCTTTVMVASRRKGDFLFDINALSDSFFDAKDNHAFTELIEEYFGESGDETEVNTDIIMVIIKIKNLAVTFNK